jgi:predicted DNA-binding protein
MQESVGKKPQRMVRKQILITPEQNRRLKARAAQAGTAKADIVRRGIELALSAEQAEDDWRAQLGRALVAGALDEHFAERVRENKRVQAEAWRKRLERTRRSLAGD